MGGQIVIVSCVKQSKSERRDVGLIEKGEMLMMMTTMKKQMMKKLM